MPAVSFLKPPTIQSGHSGESDPLDEQDFLVNTINFIEKSKFWDSTAIVVTYDDSDGWYDHQASPIVNSSIGVADFLNGTAFAEIRNIFCPASTLTTNMRWRVAATGRACPYSSFRPGQRQTLSTIS